MRIFGKELAEYIAFARVWIIVVLAVGLTRLALSLAGLPNESTKWISMAVYKVNELVGTGIFPSS